MCLAGVQQAGAGPGLLELQLPEVEEEERKQQQLGKMRRNERQTYKIERKAYFVFVFLFFRLVEGRERPLGNDEEERFSLIGSASLIEFLGLQSAFVVSYGSYIDPRAMFTPPNKIYKTILSSCFLLNLGLTYSNWTRHPPAGNVPDNSRPLSVVIDTKSASFLLP